MKDIVKFYKNKEISIKELVDFVKNNDLDEETLIELLELQKIKFKNEKDRIIDFLNNKDKQYVPYPLKNDNNFFQKIYKKKEFYENQYQTPDESTDIQKDICPSKDTNFKLLPHQIIIRNYMNINTPYNSILLFHGMGSGKTMSAITIAENYRTNLGNFNRKKSFVLVSGDTIEQNFKREIHDINKGFNQGTFTDYMNYLPTDSNEVKQKKVDELIEKNYEIEHYQKLSNILSKKKEELENNDDFKKWIKQTYSNRVFIIDEVHNLKLTDKDESTIKRYDAVKLIAENTINMKLVLLSGTPMGHSVKEIIDILNLLLLNDNKKPITLKDIFKPNLDFNDNGIDLLNDLSKSYISYITKENPYTFPQKIYNSNSLYITDFIKKKFKSDFSLQYDIKDEYKIIPCKMEEEQKNNYLKLLEYKKVNVQDLIQIQLMNYDYEKEIEKKGKDKIIYDISFDDFKESNLKKLSAKFYELLQNIKKANGPIFIYTNYIDKGVLMIASMLLRNGIDLFNSRKEPEVLLSKKSLFKSKRTRPVKNNRLCAICSKRFHEDNEHKFTPMFFDYIIGQTTEEVEKKIISTFNDPDNYNGSKLKIIIGSSVLKEGVSFLKVRQLNIMEPWHNKSRLQQVIARGVRHCSHKSLDKKDRNVEVNLYASIIDDKYDNINSNLINKLNEIFKVDSDDKLKVDINLARKFNDNLPLLSYDVIMYKRSEISNFYISKVENLLKKNSIDCSLNRKLNKVNDNYECNTFDDNFDYDLDDNDIDASTYTNLFLTPYIKFVISFILKYFKKNKIIDLDILTQQPAFQDPIYKTNDYYIIKKALNMILPTDNNLKNFPYIIEHINSNKTVSYGYIIKRKYENNFIYIFKSFDDNNVFEKSQFEQTPIYDDFYDIDNNPLKLSNFLLKLEKNDKKEKNIKLSSEVNYINILTQSSRGQKKSKKENVGSEGNNIIRNNYPDIPNEGLYVGIVINDPRFENKLWIRSKEKNNIGRDSITAFKKHELKQIIIDLWKKLDDDFKNKNQDKYNLYTTKSNVKLKLSNFLKKIFIHLNKNKVENKIWFQQL